MISKIFTRAALFVGSVIIIAAGCLQQEPYEPTTPTAAGQFEAANFITTDDTCAALEAYVEHSALSVCGAASGDAAITYTTPLGTFCVAVDILRNTTLKIGLQPGDTVTQAVLQRGTIYDRTGPTWIETGATLYAWPGGPLCETVFQADQSAPVYLIGEAPEPDPPNEPDPDGVQECLDHCQDVFDAGMSQAAITLDSCLAAHASEEQYEACTEAAFDEFVACYSACPPGGDGSCFYNCQQDYVIDYEHCDADIDAQAEACENAYFYETEQLEMEYAACCAACQASSKQGE